MSFPRKRESREPRGLQDELLWIPAFARFRGNDLEPASVDSGTIAKLPLAAARRLGRSCQWRWGVYLPLSMFFTTCCGREWLLPL